MLNLNNFLRLLLLFSAALLIACSTSQPTPQTQSQSTDPLTSTTTISPINTAIPTTIPTTQSAPSITPLPIAQFSGTPIPPPTTASTPIPTSAPTHQVIEQFPSSNEKWIAIVEKQFIMTGQNGDVNDISLLVRNVKEDFEWTVESFRADDWTSNAAQPQPLHFSKDDQYLYYTHAVLSDGCAPSGPYSDLLRFNLSTGETTEIVPRGDAYNYVVAPDGDKMAIIFKDDFVRLYEFTSGNTRNIHFQFDPEPRDVYMELLWSPDSQQLLVQANIDTCYFIPFVPSYIYRIDGTTLEKTLLIANDETEMSYNIVEWPEPDLVLLWQGGVTWYMNPWTGEVTAEIIGE